MIKEDFFDKIIQHLLTDRVTASELASDRITHYKSLLKVLDRYKPKFEQIGALSECYVMIDGFSMSPSYIKGHCKGQIVTDKYTREQILSGYILSTTREMLDTFQGLGTASAENQIQARLTRALKLYQQETIRMFKS